MGQIVTNLATNPSFETASGTVTVRTNHDPNPNCRTAATGILGYAGSGGTMTVARISGVTPPSGEGLEDVATAGRGTWTVGSTTSGNLLVADVPVTPGEVISVRRFVRGNVSAAYEGVVDFHNGATWVATGGLRSAGTLGVFQWGKLEWLNMTVPATVTTMLVYVRKATNPNAGDIVDTLGGLVEKAPRLLGPSFDGNSPAPDGDHSMVWSGPVDASTSVQQGAGVATVSGGSGRVLVQSSAWAAEGSKSVRVIPTGNSHNDAAAGAAVYDFGPSAYGKCFTVGARMRLTAAGAVASLTTDRKQRAIYVLSEVVNGAFSEGANTAGEQELRFTFQMPNTTRSLCLAGNDAVNDAWWDSLTIVEVPSLSEPYTGPLFSGRTPGAVWNGTPDGSTATWTRTYPELTPFEDDAPTPRVQAFFNVLHPDVATVTVLQSSEDGTVELPETIRATVTPEGTYVTTDVTSPLGVPVTYQARQYDAAGNLLGLTDPATTQVNLDDPSTVIIQDPLDPTRSVRVIGKGTFGSNLVRHRSVELHRRGLDTVALAGQLGLYERIPLAVETFDKADIPKLASVLEAVTILVRSMPVQPIPRCLFVAISEPSLSPINIQYGDGWAIWPLEGDQVSRPPLKAIVSVLTYTRFKAVFATYTAAKAVYATYTAAKLDPPQEQ